MFLLWLAMALALAACTTKSELRFANNTECGAATITLIDTASSQATTHTVGEGETVSIEVVPDALYRYEVTYPRDTTTNRQCEPRPSKRAWHAASASTSRSKASRKARRNQAPARG